MEHNIARLTSIQQDNVSFGVLSDGRRYAIMRCLLYTDDFQPYAFKQASAGGCYILPLGIPVWKRNGVNSIRILGVTPAGVSSNRIIDAVIPDIVKMSSEGVVVRMPDGDEIVLFLDVVGYIGDYLAMVHLLDVTGVHGVAPCSFCTFHRANRSTDEDGGYLTTENSSYGYSTAIHSGNLSFRRTRKRMQLWRTVSGDRELQRIGLRSESSVNLADLPLHRLSEELEAVCDRVPLTQHGHPVVPCVLDPYQGCFVAPDHVMIGVSQDITNAMLTLLRPSERKHTDSLATHALTTMGYTTDSSLVNTRTGRIHNMSFSSFSAFFLVLPWALRMSMRIEPPIKADVRSTTSNDSIRVEVLRGLSQCQELFFQTSYIPVAEVDGLSMVELMEKDGGREYIRRLQRMAIVVHRPTRGIGQGHYLFIY